MIFLEKVKLYIPGILVCAAIALGCTFLGQAFPLIGGPVFGILAGMAIALVWKRRDRTSQGITFTSKKILQYAVILLGFGLNLAEVVRVGAQSLPVIVSTSPQRSSWHSCSAKRSTFLNASQRWWA